MARLCLRARFAGLLSASALLCVGLSAPSAWAQPAPSAVDPIIDGQLGQAEDAFRRQDYDRTIELLDPLVAADRISDPTRKRLALERLGVSYWFTGSLDAARLTFATLLKADADYGLDPLFYPPELIGFFENEKDRLRKLGFIGGQEPIGTGPPRLRLVRTVTERRTPTFAYLMPFAVGQFANDDDAKGTALALLQAVGLATNIAAWVSVELMKSGATNRVPQSKAGQAELLQILWWIGTGVFAASYGYSVVDGFVFRPPEHDEDQRYELIDPDDLPESGGATSGVQWRVGPSAEGFGLGLGGSF